VKRFVAFGAAAVLAFDPATAGAERVGFDSAAGGSGIVQIFQGETKYTDRIHGELQLPSSGSAPFPAMVLMHSSLGINPTIGDWAKLFNDLGIATLVVDSFGPRGLSEQSANQLNFSAGVVDSLRALRTLQQDARIDSGRIGVIGFSRGAIAAMGAGFERYRAAVLGADGGKFALHIVFYGGCAQYARTTGSPILLFQGTQDDFNNLDVCRKFTEVVGRQGTRIELVVYEGALHVFDTDLPRQNMPMVQNVRNCRMLQDLDTFQAVLVDGRTLSAEERTSYSRSCRGSGAARGGDRKYASAARERVKLFVAEQFKLQR
jgi:dienelactone hydrolase